MFKEVIGGGKAEKGKKATTPEQIPETEHFAEHISETYPPYSPFVEYTTGLDPAAAEDLEDDFENRYFLGEEMQKRLIPEKKALAKEKEEKAMEQKKPYSLSDFKLMEQADKYSALAGQEPNLKKYWPHFADGKPLTIDQINELAGEYAEIKKSGKKSDYSQAELRLLTQASTWKFFHDEIEKTQKRPAFPDGKVLTKEQINELINEYRGFRQEHPEEFAEMKVENNEWLKDSFSWELVETPDGKKIWASEKPIIIKDKKTGEETKVPRKYILRETPTDFKPVKNKTYYYTIKGRTGSDIFISLKAPY
ncbi:MAG TPA: hypothetical protein VJ103_02650 [Candidatus Paceibacterota bacterium]|nr:hypothetical protein [Candidatus Paceibacterota bacterium]